MKIDSQGEKPRSVTIPLDWGKAKKLWRWLRRKRDIPPSEPSPLMASAPEDLDISPEDLKLLKLLDAQNKDWKESHDKP